MQSQHENIHSLLQRYRSGVATEEEVRQLLAYLQSGEDTAHIEALINEGLLDFEIPEAIASSPKMEKKMDDLFRQIKKRQTVSSRPQRHYLRYAAAILILFSIGFSLYYYQRDSRQSIPLADIHTDDILPGGNKATITLSDGTVIELSEDHEGIIAKGTELSYTDGEKLLDATQVQYATLTTPRGGQYQIILSDGTKVWLNAETTLRYPTKFTGTTREVTIHGEAYFEVAHNAEQPFIVGSGRQTLQVLGTSFNIDTYKGSATTTLIKGSIQVSDQMKRTKILLPGQQTVQTIEGFQINDVDTENYTAWKDGVIILTKQTPQNVLKQLERWYDVEFVHPERISPNLPLSGEIPRDIKLSVLLRALEQQTNVKFTIEGRRIMINR
ncbi:FecR family protein [Sphingobacterium spiritivorum]|uniref:FecR family protein n=1 Tax=Sphingobacterium spiritivorum TaxID=258 RepID=UPI003DA600A8